MISSFSSNYRWISSRKNLDTTRKKKKYCNEVIIAINHINHELRVNYQRIDNSNYITFIFNFLALNIENFKLKNIIQHNIEHTLLDWVHNTVFSVFLQSISDKYKHIIKYYYYIIKLISLLLYLILEGHNILVYSNNTPII